MRPSPSHARRLLANALRRLAERLAPAPPGGPSADWLERVRRGAPELLKGRAIQVIEARPSGPQSAPELRAAPVDRPDSTPPSRQASPTFSDTVEARHRSTSPWPEPQPEPRVRALRDVRQPPPRRRAASPAPTSNVQVKARADLTSPSQSPKAPPPPTYSTITARTSGPEWAVAGERSVRPRAEHVPATPRAGHEPAAWPSLPDARATPTPTPAPTLPKQHIPSTPPRTRREPAAWPSLPGAQTIQTPMPAAASLRTPAARRPQTEVVEYPPRTPAPRTTTEPPHPWPGLPDPEPPDQEQEEAREAVATLLLREHERRLDREQRG